MLIQSVEIEIVTCCSFDSPGSFGENVGVAHGARGRDDRAVDDSARVLAAGGVAAGVAFDPFADAAPRVESEKAVPVGEPFEGRVPLALSVARSLLLWQAATAPAARAASAAR